MKLHCIYTSSRYALYATNFGIRIFFQIFLAARFTLSYRTTWRHDFMFISLMSLHPMNSQSCQCCICPELWKCIEQRRSTIAHTGGSVFNLAGADLNHNKLLERQLTVKNSRKRRPTAPLDLACGAASANHANHRNSDVIYGSFCRRCLVSRFFLSRFSISRLLLFCIRFESITSICFLVAIFCSINWTMN